MTDRERAVLPWTDDDVRDLEWAVWFARKVKGTSREVAVRALEQNPTLRFSERERLASPDTAPSELRAAAQAVVDSAEPDENFEGEFIDWIVSHDALLELRQALAALRGQPETPGPGRAPGSPRHHTEEGCPVCQHREAMRQQIKADSDAQEARMDALAAKRAERKPTEDYDDHIRQWLEDFIDYGVSIGKFATVDDAPNIDAYFETLDSGDEVERHTEEATDVPR